MSCVYLGIAEVKVQHDIYCLVGEAQFVTSLNGVNLKRHNMTTITTMSIKRFETTVCSK